MDKIEKIRNELERRIALYSRLSEYNIDPNRIDEDEQLLAFIDSLEDKPTDYTNFTQKEVHSQGYDESYLNDCIARAKKSWEGVDVDRYMDMVRGKEPVSDELEEEVKNYFQGYWPGTETAEQCNTDLHFTPLAILRLARHFAEWQRQRDEKLITPAKDSWYHQGLLDGKFMLLEYDERYQQGRFDMKEQMMKEAVEGVIMGDIGSQEDEPHDIYVESASLPLDGKWKMGDKVRIIVLPKED